MDHKSNHLKAQGRNLVNLQGILLALSIATILALTGCGGGVGGTGGGAGGGGDGGNGGVGGTGVVSLGTISKADAAAVTVNGTVYQITAETKITVDSRAAEVTDLQPGMVVEVDAYKYTDTKLTEAEQISYHSTLVGPISAISTDCGSMILLGQTVEADTNTLPTLTRGLCDYSVGQVVEISGFISNPTTNSVRATFVRKKEAAALISVSGNIASVSTLQKLLVIGALTVDYAGARFEPVGAEPKTGNYVKIEGIATGASTVTATQVKIVTSSLTGAAGTEAEVTGFISGLNGSAFFANTKSIDSSRAKISPSAAVLADGVKVEVHGKLDGNGILVATEIEVKSTSLISIESSVEGKTAGGLTLLGTTILVNSETKILDQNGLPSSVKLGDIQLNDQISVSCYRDAGGNYVASKIVLKTRSGKFVAEGAVVSVQPAQNTFSMIQDLGIVVLIDPEKTELIGGEGRVTSAAEFLTSLRAGSRIKAEGIHGIGKTLDATAGKVELLDGD